MWAVGSRAFISGRGALADLVIDKLLIKRGNNGITGYARHSVGRSRRTAARVGADKMAVPGHDIEIPIAGARVRVAHAIVECLLPYCCWIHAGDF